jgi:CheY-like chemotaxis protein/two-component sensor histidine kinase
MDKDFSAQYFLSNLSHQIRTPLNGIIGYTQLLSSTKLDRTQKGYINSINTCSLQLISLINDILDFSKLATGKGQCRKECFSFLEVIEEVKSTIGGRIKEKQQKIHFVTERDIPEYIISDKQKIIQILINLISNASKFSPSNTRIIVNIRQCVDDPPIDVGTIQITVEDSGIGIYEHDIVKLFNPFVQIQDSLTKNGSGLGLAICKKLVELLGGSISVQSIKGQGSVFTFTLKYDSYYDFKKYVEKNCTSLKDKIILILADNVDTRISIAEMLFDAGIRPIICSSSKEVFKMLECKRYTFSAIIADICLPDISGSKLCKQIKEIDPEIPIIALAQLEEILDCTGYEKIIHKPVNNIKLLDTLFKAIMTDDIISLQVNNTIQPPKKEFKILVVEDVSYNLEMLVKMLNTIGYLNIDTATDGEEAISKLDSHLYDIILLDLKMQKKTGIDVIEHIRDKGISTTIAVLTASVINGDRDKCEELGIKYFLLKPFGMNNLKLIMNKLTN